MAFEFLVALDSLRRAVGAVTPLDRQREHLRQDREQPVGAVRRALADLPVKRVDVAIGDVRHLEVSKLRQDVLVDQRLVFGA